MTFPFTRMTVCGLHFRRQASEERIQKRKLEAGSQAKAINRN